MRFNKRPGFLKNWSGIRSRNFGQAEAHHRHHKKEDDGASSMSAPIQPAPSSTQPISTTVTPDPSIAASSTPTPAPPTLDPSAMAISAVTSPVSQATTATQTPAITPDVSSMSPVPAPPTPAPTTASSSILDPASVAALLTATPVLTSPPIPSPASTPAPLPPPPPPPPPSIPTPVISGFQPLSGVNGTNIVVTGSGFTGATAVSLSGTSATFAVSGDTQITTTVPNGISPGPVNIAITTPGGTATSSTPFTILAPAPTISGFSPSSAMIGSKVTVNGSNFTGATNVMIGSANTPFMLKSDTKITLTIPSDANGPIVVTTPSGNATSSGNFTSMTPTSTMPAPAIYSFDPQGGNIGSLVSIMGANFTGTVSVSFDGIGAIFRVINDGQIDAKIPRGATSGSIEVITPGGSTTSGTPFDITGAESGIEASPIGLLLDILRIMPSPTRPRKDMQNVSRRSNKYMLVIGAMAVIIIVLLLRTK